MKTKAELNLVLVTLLWAGTFSMVKSALTSISPMLLVTIRFTIAAAVLLLIFRGRLFKIPKATVIKGFNLGILLSIGFATQAIGLLTTTASKSALITGTFVIITPIMQTLIEKKPPKIANIIGIILVFLGMIFLSTGETNIIKIFQNIGTDFTIGDFLTLICAFSYAGYIVYLDIISPDTKFLDIVWLQIVFTMVISAILVIFFDIISFETIMIEWNIRIILTIIYTSIFATLVTTYLQTKYQKFTTPTRAAIIFTGEPLLASFIAFIALHETFTAFGYLGGILIIFGILFSELFDKSKNIT